MIHIIRFPSSLKHYETNLEVLCFIMWQVICKTLFDLHVGDLTVSNVDVAYRLKIIIW